MELDFKNFDVNEALSNIRERAIKRQATREIALTSAPQSTFVKGDRLLLEQALWNIVDNSLKYSPANCPIRIEAVAENGLCLITVADRGDGIPPRDLKKVFDKFHYARRERDRNRGTGLGLSIAKGFVEAMGGTIEASVRADGASGLEVRLTLPKVN
jgi:two-component system sensor histidine kinase KdpD